MNTPLLHRLNYNISLPSFIAASITEAQYLSAKASCSAFICSDPLPNESSSILISARRARTHGVPRYFSLKLAHALSTNEVFAALNGASAHSFVNTQRHCSSIRRWHEPYITTRPSSKPFSGIGWLTHLTKSWILFSSLHCCPRAEERPIGVLWRYQKPSLSAAAVDIKQRHQKRRLVTSRSRLCKPTEHRHQYCTIRRSLWTGLQLTKRTFLYRNWSPDSGLELCTSLSPFPLPLLGAQTLEKKRCPSSTCMQPPPSKKAMPEI